MLKILAIDDNQDNLISLKALVLESFPEASVVTANTGIQGIERAIHEDPDVILLDIVMPGMDGFEVCRKLKADPILRDIPVVFLTALKVDKESRICALESGGEAFLSKPIDEIELTVQIRAMVKIKSSNIQKRDEQKRLSQQVAERTCELEKNQEETLKLLDELRAENELRKIIETELRESEEKFRLLHESAGVGIGYYTPDGIVISYNKLAAKNMNGKPKDFCGKSVYTIFPKEDADFYVERIKKAVNSEHSQAYEDKVNQPTEVKWFNRVFSRIKNSEDKIIGVQIVSSDISQHKLDEAVIKLEQARLKRAELASKLGNWELHIDSKIMTASEGASKIYGLEKNKFNYENIKSIPLPEYRLLLDTALKNLIENNEPYDLEFKIKTADSGKIKNIHSLAIYDKEKRILFGVIQDITEQKKIEEKLIEEQLFNKTLIENLPGIFYIYSYPHMKILQWNKNHETMLGITGEELKNAMSAKWLHPDTRDNIVSAMHIVAQSGNAQIEASFRRKDGTYIPFILNGARLVNNDQLFIMGFGTDITEWKKAEEALKNSETRLRELNATKDKFFSIIAHDLKSPFNSIMGLSELLVEQIQNNDYEGIEEYANIIQNSSKRAMDLLLNLLEWSRSQTGRMEFNPEYIELVSLINEVIELANDSAQQKTITISKELPPKVIAYADKSMISAILRNLISNAIKFTKTGGMIKISVIKNRTDLQVCVTDNGVGITPGDINKLFRLDENHTTLGTQNEKGTGLGLILCKEFIEKHKGKIWIESKAGVGSQFYLTIPNH